jgi:leucyl aminopeptidase
MIKLNNKENFEYRLVLATENDLKDDFLKHTKDSAVFDQKSKTFYLKLNDKREDQRKELTKKLASFIQKNSFDLNVEVDSFVKGLINKETFGEGKIFNTIVETIALNTHKPVMMKKSSDDKAKEASYNLITKSAVLEKMFEKELIKSEFVNYARDLQDTPPNIATSE